MKAAHYLDQDQSLDASPTISWLPICCECSDSPATLKVIKGAEIIIMRNIIPLVLVMV
jgi:hypothetical protein